MFKNISPKVIALLTAVLLTGLFGLFIVYYESFTTIFNTWEAILISLVLIFFLSYIINALILEKYIYRRVKLIYKIIRDSKTSVEDPVGLTTDSNILSTVSDDVAQWAQQHEEEIASLKQLERYRKNFIGNVSHELKTPIFSAQAYIQTLIDGGLEDEEINMRYLEKASQNIERLTTIVEDLEAISRLEQGMIELDLQTFDIKLLAQEVIDNAEFLIRAKNASVIFKEGADQNTYVNADRENIRQVLSNLITNALKYGSENGRIQISFYNMDEYILIEVADNGIGIEEEHLNHLFDRFYRVDKSRSRQMGGSGLGLAIVKHIIEAHNQALQVRSTKGEGSTFGFTLEKASRKMKK